MHIKSFNKNRRQYIWKLNSLMAAVAPVVVLGVVAATAGIAVAHEGKHPHAEKRMVRAAAQFLESLSPELREHATFPFDDKERQHWNFIPMERQGALLKEMDASQRRAAHDLMKTALSSQGYLKATTIMSLEQILRELESDRPGNEARRDQEKYWLAVFGTPSIDQPWGWRIEGHHLSLNFTVVGQHRFVSQPFFLGANPAEVREGPRAGLRVLGTEEDLARRLIRSLSAEQRAQAIIDESAPDDIHTAPGKPIDLGEPAGISVRDMKPPQSNSLLAIIREFANNLRADVARAELAEIREHGVEKIHFAWAGSLKPGQPHYYRIHGPTFIIEYDNIQNDANHIHAVWHSTENEFGLDALKKHYEQSHQK